MTIKISYKVHPNIPTDLMSFSNETSSFDTGWILVPLILDVWFTIVWAIYNLFAGGIGWLIFCGIGLILYIIMTSIQSKQSKISAVNALKAKSEFLSKQMNDILSKSEEIVTTILPYYEESTVQSLNHAQNDFNDNAISPFWDRIEDASKSLAYYKEAVDQLVYNGELYTQILKNEKHNFPLPFPIGTSISIQQDILDEYNSAVRKAQSKFEFANIWEHRKTQKILIEGFANLEQAIKNMRDSILSAIGELNHSLKSEFRELKNLQIKQINSIEEGNEALNTTLSSMNSKLYYMQYNKKPITPFVRPISDHFS